MLFFFKIDKKSLHLFFQLTKLASFKNQNKPGEEREGKKEQKNDFSKAVGILKCADKNVNGCHNYLV
jgi:hypothetical protein